MAISRNQRRLNAKKRATLAACDAINTAQFLAKAAVIRGNCKELGRKANAMGTGRIVWLDPTRRPLGYTRRLKWSQGVAG